MEIKISKYILIISFIILIASCSNESGSLNFTANGEDFSTKPFTSKDNWNIDLDDVLINIGDITAYNINDSNLNVTLPGIHSIHFNSDSIVDVGTLKEVPVGNYQSLKFSLKQLTTGEYKGYSIIMKGVATRDTDNINFIIKLNEELTFDGKEGFVGDSIKGLLTDKESTVEMTFHFDHIFGDALTSASEHVNTNSPGFDFFIPTDHDGVVVVDQKQLISKDNYDLLIKSIESLGHLGEGHCEVIR